MFKFQDKKLYFIKGHGDKEFRLVSYSNGTLWKLGGGDKCIPALVTEAYEADITLGNPVEEDKTSHDLLRV